MHVLMKLISFDDYMITQNCVCVSYIAPIMLDGSEAYYMLLFANKTSCVMLESRLGSMDAPLTYGG